MMVIRSTRCSLAGATRAKRESLNTILAEYGKVVNHFIDLWWGHGPPPKKTELFREVIAYQGTWLSARLRKVAAREAIDMMCIQRAVWHGCPQTCPQRQENAWLHIACVGRNIIINLPVRFHRHYHRYARNPKARRLESNIITGDSVQLTFEVDVEPRMSGPAFGVDTSINTLAALPDGTRLGTAWLRDSGSFLMEGRHSAACLKICGAVPVRGHTVTGWTG